MEKQLPISQRSFQTENLDIELQNVYRDIFELFKPISFQPNWDSGIPYGVTVRDYMEKLPLDSWQNKIRYYRLSKGISHNVMAKRLGMKNGMSYTKKYETGYAYYTTVENYYKVCNALGIEYEDTSREGTLVNATVYLICQSERQEYTFAFVVYPKT